MTTLLFTLSKATSRAPANEPATKGLTLAILLRKGASLAEIEAYPDRLRAAREKTHPSPSAAQKEAGNYSKGRVEIHGLTIAIENPKGSVRQGTSASGHHWKTKLGADYGYFTRRHGSDKTPMGVDGDPVDVFIGSHPQSECVYVVDQVNRDGEFDEHKVVLGCRNEAEARATYLSCYSAGWTGLGAITPMTMPGFKRWLAEEESRRDAVALKKAMTDGPSDDKQSTGRDRYHWCPKCNKAGSWDRGCPNCRANVSPGEELRDPRCCENGHVFDARGSDEDDPEKCPRCGKRGDKLGMALKAVSSAADRSLTLLVQLSPSA